MNKKIIQKVFVREVFFFSPSPLNGGDIETKETERRRK
jgi:hypothetical protein